MILFLCTFLGWTTFGIVVSSHAWHETLRLNLLRVSRIQQQIVKLQSLISVDVNESEIVCVVEENMNSAPYTFFLVENLTEIVTNWF